MTKTERRPDPERIVAALLVLVPVLWNLFLLWPDVRWCRWDLNDGVLHLTAIERMVEAPKHGENPLDFWLSEWSLGYPFFHTYQPLPHLLVAGTGALLPRVAILDVFCVLRWLLVALWPLCAYASARTIGLSRLAAGCAAFFSPFLSTDGWFGLEYGSYLWRGSGLFTQLVAMWTFPPALAWTWRAVRQGRGHGWAALFVALTLLAHIFYGWAALLAIPLALLLPGPSRAPELLSRRFAAAAVLLALAFLATAWFTVPALLDGRYANRSRWEYGYKWDSYGAGKVLGALGTGDLLDRGRFPAITLLLAAGIAAVLVQGLSRDRRSEEEPQAERFTLAAFVLYLLLFLGRPVWGALLDLLPGTRDLPLHRMVGPVHWFALLLVGTGLAAAAEWIGWRRTLHGAAASAILLAAFATPVLMERYAFIRQGNAWGLENEKGVLAEKADVDEVMRLLREDGAGRVYPGLAGGWGRDFKVGMTSFYAFLSRAHIDSIAFLYHSMALTSDVMVHFQEEASTDWDLFHVTHAVTPADRDMPGLLVPWKDVGPYRIWRAPPSGWFSPYRLRSSFQGGKQDFYQASVDWMRGTGPATGEGLQLRFPGEPAHAPLLGLGKLLEERRDGQTYSAVVETDAPGTVWMLKHTFHPGWKATVDGRPAETVMMAPGFLGVPAPGGRHTIACRYSSGSLKAALLPVGGVALLLCVAIGIAGRRWAGAIEGWIAPLLGRAGAACARAFARLSPRARGLALAVLIAIPVGIPLLGNRMPSGHDALEYLPRLVEFHENVRQGILLPRWAPDLASGHGEPLFLFSPPVLYYLAEAIHVLGASHVLSLNLALLLLALLSAAFAYLLAHDLAEGGPPGVRSGLVAAALYVYAPYFLTDLYVRAAWAEFTAFPWLALALWGILRATRGHRAGILAAALGTALIALSHNAVFLLSVPVLAAGIVLAMAEGEGYAGRFLAFLRAGTAVGVGLLLASFFYLPVLLEMSRIRVHLLTEGYLSYVNHFVYPWQLVWSRWGHGLSLPGWEDQMPLHVGPLHLAFAITALCVWRSLAAQAARLRFWVPALAALALLYLFLATEGSRFLWDRIGFLQYMAFPWRALGPATLCLAVLGGLATVRLRETAYPGAVLATAILLVVGLAIGNARPQRFETLRLEDWTPVSIAARGVSVTTKNEFRPLTAVTEPTWWPGRARVRGDGVVQPLLRTPEREILHVTAATAAEVEVATFDFPGWTVQVGGKEVTHRTDSPSGRIVFGVPAGDHLVELTYRRTGAQKAGLALSLLGGALLVALIWLTGSRRAAPCPAEAGSPPAS